MNTHKPIITISLLILVSTGIYLNSLRGEFVYDDLRLVVENSYLRTLANLLEIFTTVSYWGENLSSRAYRPLFTTMHTVLYQFTGEDTLGYHLFNVLFHVLNTVLLYLICLKLFRQVKPAFFTALLFGVHPVHTEAVSGIAGGAEVTAGFFLLLLFYLFIRNMKFNGRTVIVTVLCVSGALLCKENTITIIGLMALYLFLFRQEHTSEQRNQGFTGPRS